MHAYYFLLLTTNTRSKFHVICVLTLFELLNISPNVFCKKYTVEVTIIVGVIV